MRLALLVLLCCFTAGAHAESAAYDQALRYVNGAVITSSDVRERNAMRVQEYAITGKVVPQTKAEIEAFMQASLEALTDEELMVQRARELKLVPDHDRIVLDVLERANREGRGRSLAEQARARRQLERQQCIDFLLTYFHDQRTPQITPEAMRGVYDRRRDEFRRPPRARALTIVLRATDPAIAKDLRRAKADLFKRAQGAADPVIAAAASSRIDAYVADGVTMAEQTRLLDECLAEIAAQAERADLDESSRQLAQLAVELKTDADAVVDLDQCRAQLEAARGELTGKGEEAFRAAARRLSKGRGADEGGEQGWTEPGTFPTEVEQRLFALPTGEVSEVLIANQAAWLLLVLEREDARVRSFDEVAGEIESALRRDRREAMRQLAASILRSKASVRDVAPVASILD